MSRYKIINHYCCDFSPSPFNILSLFLPLYLFLHLTVLFHFLLPFLISIYLFASLSTISPIAGQAFYPWSSLAWPPDRLCSFPPPPPYKISSICRKKKKKATVKRHSTSYPLSSRYSPILNWICFNSAIFVWLNPPKKKGQQINWQNIPLVSLLIGSTGEPAFLSSAKTIKHAVAGITADTVVVVGCCNSRVFRSSPNFSVLY